MTANLSAEVRAVVRAFDGLTTQVRRIADALTTPVVRYEVAADDAPTTPATTCSAQYTGSDNPWTQCIRAAHHEHPFHTDERGWNWRDDVAAYPLPDSTVRISHWRPMSEQPTEEQQELAGMVSEFIDAQTRTAPAADEVERCITHWHGTCDGTTPDCAFPTPGTGRRRRLRVLLNRLNNGIPLSADEAQKLTQHVATEITEHNTARKRAEQAEELLRVAHETSNRSEAARAEEERLRLALAEERDRWKERTEEARAEMTAAQAAIERVRAHATDAKTRYDHGRNDYEIGRYDMAVEVLAALDGTDQPTTEAP